MAVGFESSQPRFMSAFSALCLHLKMCPLRILFCRHACRWVLCFPCRDGLEPLELQAQFNPCILQSLGQGSLSRQQKGGNAEILSHFLLHSSWEEGTRPREEDCGDLRDRSNTLPHAVCAAVTMFGKDILLLLLIKL